MSKKYKLIVGLGNIGVKYRNNRHNIGFWCIDQLVALLQLRLTVKHNSLCSIYNNIILAKPQGYMNTSSQAIDELVRFYHIDAADIIIVHDDLDLNVGEIRLKFSSGSGGHNGLKNISSLAGTKYWHLKIGIGHPGDKTQVSEYVLSNPTPTEMPLLTATCAKIVQAAPLIFNWDIAKAQQYLHTES